MAKQSKDSFLPEGICFHFHPCGLHANTLGVRESSLCVCVVSDVTSRAATGLNKSSEGKVLSVHIARSFCPSSDELNRAR